MIARAFNSAGMTEASLILDRLRSGELAEVPTAFLEREDLSVQVQLQLPRPRPGEIDTRFTLALWLWKKLEPVNSDSALLSNEGFWTWLAFFLFDTIAPVRARGRNILEDARYILAKGDYRKYYRHLVAGPLLLIRTHSEAPHIVRGLLATLPDSPGDIYEQIAARPPIVTSQAAVAVATKLYFDAESKRFRRGAAGAGPGSARRYANVLMQYDVTFDLHTVSENKLLSMLPREFNKFMSSDSSEEPPEPRNAVA